MKVELSELAKGYKYILSIIQ